MPADGFYEWKREDKAKQPHHFALKDGSEFAFAGHWEMWRDSEGGDLVSCTIVTTEANTLVATVHPRMPAMLEPGDYDI